MNEVLDIFFPIPLYIADTDISPVLINSTFDRLVRDSEDLNNHNSNWGGGSYVISSFKDKKDFHLDHANTEIVKAVYHYIKRFENHIELDIANGGLQIAESWYNISTEGMYQEFHNHSGVGPFCGIFYLSSPVGSGNTVFRATFPSERPYFRSTNINNMFYRYKKSVVPRSGRLIIFPSWLEHSVNRSNCSQPRVTLAFNFSH